MNLHGKRFLFFSARAFGIPENIVSALEMSGAHVDYYDERPANTFLVKALIRINRNLIASYINSYHRQIIFNVRHARYDYILFIKGESFSENNLKLLIEQHPESKTIIYHWDSIANNNNAINLIPYFNKVFSFDRYDCKKLGMNFLPLFYYNEYKEVAKFKSGYDYDLMFVGTTHSDRYRFIRSISSQIKMNGGHWRLLKSVNAKLLNSVFMLVTRFSGLQTLSHFSNDYIGVGALKLGSPIFHECRTIHFQPDC